MGGLSTLRGSIPSRSQSSPADLDTSDLLNHLQPLGKVSRLIVPSPGLTIGRGTYASIQIIKNSALAFGAKSASAYRRMIFHDSILHKKMHTWRARV